MKIASFILSAMTLCLLLSIAAGLCFPQPKPPTPLTALAVVPVTLLCVAAFVVGLWLVLRS